MDTIFGPLRDTPYKAETEGIRSTFREGRVYRHPGHPPMAELSGTHYEMGLQYGVLLREDLRHAMEAFEPAFALNAAAAGLPPEHLLGYLKQQAAALSQGVPARFLDEIKGICAGSGMDYDTALAMALSYDLSMAAGCTSVVVTDSIGRRIHGRHDDSAWTLGNAVMDVLAIAKYRAEGCREIVQPGPLLFLGVETGYNSAGISFSEETLHPAKPNPAGGSLPYFVRAALEESDTLQDILDRAEGYPFIGGYGMVFCSRAERKAMLVEAAGPEVRHREAPGPIFWNFNQYYDPDLIPLEQPGRRVLGYAPDRERLASEFPAKAAYELSDLPAFLRTQRDKDGVDYAWCGSRTAICNSHTQQTTIFDPDGDGFYFAAACSFAGMAPFYHYHQDFAQTPTLWASGAPLPDVVREDAWIENMPAPPAEKLRLRLELLAKFPEDANMHFTVAAAALAAGQFDLVAKHGQEAHRLAPGVAEYALWAGAGCLREGRIEEGRSLLGALPAWELTPYQQILRLWLLDDPGLAPLLEATHMTEEAPRAVFPLWEGMRP